MKRHKVIFECADCKVEAAIESTLMGKKENVEKWDDELGPDCPVCESSNTFKDYDKSTV
ncbi:MAG: hypothetical protein ABEI78_01420 [Candidatus Nanohaloarchaea archaeon]